MKKKIYWMLAAVYCLVTSTTILASCSDNDDLGAATESTINQADKAAAEFAKNLVGDRLDFSEILIGNEGLGKWDILKDGTFTFYRISPDENGVLKADTLTGTWKPFFNIDNPWDPSENAEKMSGFFATFKGDDIKKLNLPEGSGNEATLTYFVEKTEQDSMFVVSRDCISYIYMKNCYSTTPATRSFLDAIGKGGDWFKEKVIKPIAILFEKEKKIIVNLLGTDGAPVDYEQFKQYADKAFQDLQDATGIKQTDYSHWIGDIYGNSNPRICDMNIPGSHDTFTYNASLLPNTAVTVLINDVTKAYAKCQTLNLDEQWKVGIRSFDVRFKKDGYIYHGPCCCRISVQEALDGIYDKLQQNPDETAIVFLQAEGDKNKEVYDKIVEIMSKNKGKVVATPKPDMRLNDCRGKIIVFQEWDLDNNDPEHRVAPTMESLYNRYGISKLNFYDGKEKTTARVFYQNKCQAEELDLPTEFWAAKKNMMTECFKETAATKGKSEPVWAVNQASGNVGGLRINMSYTKNANHMNPFTFSYVVNNKEKKMNIVTMDFAGSDDKEYGFHCNGKRLPEAIVLSNKFQ